MSAVWTKEMAEEFLESKPDPLFPCDTGRALRRVCVSALERTKTPINGYHGELNPWMWGAVYDQHRLNIERDALGRCKLQCASCNCRMLFNQLECVKADLETTKETLNITSVNLDDTMVELGETRIALEECKKERNEEKRKFSAAIATMVQSEMSDVRTQLTALNLCLKDELGEKSLAKAATSEAAKAALSASKFIKLRLLMF
jgi:hypothetical protein